MDIRRIPGKATGRSSGTVFPPFAWAVAVAQDDQAGVAEQTRQTLARIDEILTEAGTNRARILSATIYMADLAKKKEMDPVWDEWVGPDRAGWPQRACVGAKLAANYQVEIVVLAALP